MAHSITLSFATLGELSAAVDALTRAHTEPVGNATQISGDATKTATTKAKTDPKPAPAVSAAPAPTPAASPSQAAAAPATAKGVDYPTLQKAVFELAGLADKKGLDKSVVLDIAKAHGGDNFKGLKPDTYAAALADVQSKIAEVSAAEVSAAEESVA